MLKQLWILKNTISCAALISLSVGCTLNIKKPARKSVIQNTLDAITFTAGTVQAGGTSWSDVTGAHLKYARTKCGMTYAPDGKVVMVGGMSDGAAGSVLPIEYYDPAAAAGLQYSIGPNPLVDRENFSSTLLPDHRLVLIGGTDQLPAYTAIASVHIFDPSQPVNSQWTVMDPLPAARESPTAILLSNGKILVTGGNDTNGNAITTVDLFNPLAATGSQWTTLDTDQITNENPTAVALNTGSVLFLSISSGAKILNPSAATGSQWTTPDQPALLRVYPGIIKLQNGKILMVGGQYYDNGLSNYVMTASAELFDPLAASGSQWTSVDAALTARQLMHLSLLSDGKVVVTGGETASNTAPKQIEMFNPSASSGSQWTALDNAQYGLPSSNYSTVLVLPNDDLVMGCTENFAFVQVLHPTAASGSQVQFIGEIKSQPGFNRGSKTLSDGRVIFVGGMNSSPQAPMDKVDIFDASQPVGSQWIPQDPIPSDPRFFQYTKPVFLPDDRVVLISGMQSGNPTQLSNLIFDPNQSAGNQWRTLDALPTAIGIMASAELGASGHKVLACGGMTPGGTLMSTCYEVDVDATAGSQITVTDSMHAVRMMHAMVHLNDGRVAIIGGATDDGMGGISPTGATEIYNPAAGSGSKFTVIDPKPSVHVLNEVEVLANGKIFISGGMDNFVSPTFTDATYILDASAATGSQWTAADSSPWATATGSTTRLPDGRILMNAPDLGSATTLASLFTSGTLSIFDPAAASGSQWTALNNSNVFYYLGNVNILPDGTFLVNGGLNESGYSTDYSMLSLTTNQITLTPTNGTAPYTYQVISGTATVDASGVVTSSTSGSVDVRITDSAGAVGTATLTFP